MTIPSVMGRWARHGGIHGGIKDTMDDHAVMRRPSGHPSHMGHFNRHPAVRHHALHRVFQVGGYEWVLRPDITTPCMALPSGMCLASPQTVRPTVKWMGSTIRGVLPCRKPWHEGHEGDGR